MPRPLWKGHISFGLVNFAVELYSATRETRPHFRLLHAPDSSPVKYDRVCQREGRPVPWEDLVKGYEYEKGKFVVLTKKDFQSAALEKSKTIDILNFVDSREVDHRFFETSYYLLPGAGGERAYALLREAIRESEKVGIGKIILRESQHLTALIVVGDALVLTTMRFAEELVDLSSLHVPPGEGVRPKELELARMLVDGLTGSWTPEKYTDDYRKNLMRVIEAKVQGVKPRLEAPEEVRDEGVVDLMERLRRSLAAHKRPGAKRPAHRKKRGKKKGLEVA